MYVSVLIVLLHASDPLADLHGQHRRPRSGLDRLQYPQLAAVLMDLVSLISMLSVRVLRSDVRTLD